MARTVVAVTGSYRRGGTVDRAVAEVLAGAAEAGARTVAVDLLDRPIGFCTNCRSCMQAAGERRGECVQRDDMAAILDEIDRADALVLGAPVNFYNVTALFRRFMERTVCYGYWPWGKGSPRNRLKKTRPAVLVTSSAMPASWVRVLTGAVRALKATAGILGFRTAGTLVVGLAATAEKQPLPDKVVGKARELGRRLATA